MRDTILKASRKVVDGIFALIPHAAPRPRRSRVRFVAHRGNTGEARAAKENTLAAFRRCAELGAWGIELDVRWSADGVPVVIHDPDTVRVFGGRPLVIGERRFEDIARLIPEVPPLEAVLREFGGRLHVMVELKQPPLDRARRATLKRLFADLEPAVDFHLLSLDVRAFDSLRDFPPRSFMAVAEVNVGATLEAAARRGFGAVGGHYLLFTRARRERLKRLEIGFGSGFVDSRNLLHREIGLGSDWIFTDRAARLKAALDELARR